MGTERAGGATQGADHLEPDPSNTGTPKLRTSSQVMSWEFSLQSHTGHGGVIWSPGNRAARALLDG